MPRIVPVPQRRVASAAILSLRIKTYCFSDSIRYILHSRWRCALQRLLAPREAANILGISYPTLKQWIYHGKIKSVKTPGGHHRVPESEIDRLFPRKLSHGDIETRRGNFRKISGRNQLIGLVLEIKYSGLLAQVRLEIGEQQITAIITADAAKEMRLKPGERAAALVKSTEVMILRV